MTIRHAITGERIAAAAAGPLVLLGLGATLPGRAEAYKQAAAASRLLERKQLGDFFACTTGGRQAVEARRRGSPLLDSLGQVLSAYQAATRGLQRAIGQAPGPAD